MNRVEGLSADLLMTLPVYVLGAFATTVALLNYGVGGLSLPFVEARVFLTPAVDTNEWVKVTLGATVAEVSEINAINCSLPTHAATCWKLSEPQLLDANVFSDLGLTFPEAGVAQQMTLADRALLFVSAGWAFTLLGGYPRWYTTAAFLHTLACLQVLLASLQARYLAQALQPYNPTSETTDYHTQITDVNFIGWSLVAVPCLSVILHWCNLRRDDGTTIRENFSWWFG